jgi:hypothetical protein
MIPPDYQRYLDLGIPQWSIGDEGPLRDRVFSGCVEVEYGQGAPTSTIRFGAFVGWQLNYRRWLEMAETLPAGAIAATGLLDMEHQAGGLSCIPWFCHGLPVVIHADYLAFAAGICRNHYHVCNGYLDGEESYTAPLLRAYLERMRAAGLDVDCDMSRHGCSFMEAVYPMEGSDRNLRRFLADPQTALKRLAPILAFPGMREKLRIFLLCDNCD